MPPILDNNWVSPAYIAAYYNRSTRMVRNWCSDGTLIDFGFIVAQTSDHRWWIKPPSIPLGSMSEPSS